MTSPAQLITSPYWQPFRFSGKELERQNGLNMYDYGARLFDVAGVPVWTKLDPLAEDNAPVTPYSYCNGDPVNRIDLDGKKIDFVEGTSDIFKSQFQQAIDYLQENNCGEEYQTLEAAEKTYYIKESSYQNSFDNKSIIEWAPLKGMYTESNDGYNLLSPATLLNHELGHAYDLLKNSDYDPRAIDFQYDLVVERYAITVTETKTAKALGKLKHGEVTRSAYNGVKLDAKSPISNNLIITPEVKMKIQMWDR